MSYDESIFKSMFRSLFKTLGGFIGFFLAIIVLGLLLVFLPQHTASINGLSKPVVMANAEGEKEMLPASSPVVLRIPIRGVIGTPMLSSKSVINQLNNSQGLGINKGRVKAILLDIQSPGGAAVDSYSIFSAVMNYKKKYKVPVYAYIDGMCASGGMMIACSADRIYSSPTGLIGSVGVILGPLFNVSQLMDRLGIEQKTFTEGIGKDEMSPFRKWKEGEGESIQKAIEYDYKLFVDTVVEHRPRMSRNALINTYGAHIFDPETAMQHGYIDQAGASYNLALMDLVKAAKIEGKYQVLELKPVFSLDQFSNSYEHAMGKKVKVELPFLSEFLLDNMGKPLYLYAPYLESK